MVSSRLNPWLAVAEARSFGLQDFLCFQPLTLLLGDQFLLVEACSAVVCCVGRPPDPDQSVRSLGLLLMAPIPEPGIIERFEAGGIEPPGVLEVVGADLL